MLLKLEAVRGGGRGNFCPRSGLNTNERNVFLLLHSQWWPHCARLEGGLEGGLHKGYDLKTQLLPSTKDQKAKRQNDRDISNAYVFRERVKAPCEFLKDNPRDPWTRKGR